MVALLVAVVIVVTGVRLLARSSRVLVDEALPPDEVDAIREAIADFAPRGVVGYHELRTRQAGARRYVDLHVQFRAGTSLEAAHRTAHELQDVIAERLRGADVLIHLEPEDRVRPGQRLAVGSAAELRVKPAVSAQVDRRREADGERHAGVAEVALDRRITTATAQAATVASQPARARFTGRIVSGGEDRPRAGGPGPRSRA